MTLKGCCLTQGCSSVRRCTSTRVSLFIPSVKFFRSEAKVFFSSVESRGGSSFPSYLVRSAAPHHCLFLPGATRMPPSVQPTWLSGYLSTIRVLISPVIHPAASNVTSCGSITLQASTESLTICSKSTGKEKIKSTEQAFLK